MTSLYNKDIILSFINRALNINEPYSEHYGKEIDEEMLEAAAFALIDSLNGEDMRKKMGINKNRGDRGPEKDIQKVTIDDPMFGVTLSWQLGKIKYGKAVEDMMRITNKSERICKDYLRDLRPRAEQACKLIHWLESKRKEGAEK